MRQHITILLLINWLVLITHSRAAITVHSSKYIQFTDTLRIKKDSLTDESLESVIKYTAKDSIVYYAELQKIFLYGDATVDYSGANLKAALIEIDTKNNLVTAKGALDSAGKGYGYPVFKDAENEMKCEKIIYNLKSKKGKIYGVLTKQAEMLVYGDQIKKDTNDVMYIKNAKCIPCDFEDAKFYFRASRAKVIPNDKIITGPVFVEVSNIKTPLGLPFGVFPNIKNKSKSGIIFPSFNNGSLMGPSLSNGGYYFPINEKTELLLTGDISTSGSWAVRARNNYRVRYRYSGSLSFEYMELYQGEKEIPPDKDISLAFKKINTFSLNWSHNQDSRHRLNDQFSANVNLQGRLNNKYNSSSNTQYLSNTFFSNIAYSHSFSNSSIPVIKNSNLSLNARHNQNTLNRSMEITLPELTYTINRSFPFKNENRSNQNWLDKLGVNYTLSARSTLRGTDTSMFTSQNLNNIQSGMFHQIPVSTNFNLFKYFTLTPNANFTAVMYPNSIRQYYDKDKKKVITDTLRQADLGADASFGTSLSTKIFGDFYFKTKRLKQIRHFIIPTASFTYHPDLTHSPIGGIRYYEDTLKVNEYSIFTNSIYGGPVSRESGSINLNFNNSLDAKVRKKSDTGYVYEKVPLIQNISISANYDVAAKQYAWSMIQVSGRNRVWKNIDLMASAQFDPYSLDSAGRRQNVLLYSQNKQFARFTDASLAINASFSPELFAKPGSNATPNSSWNISMNYIINFRKDELLPPSQQYTQTLNFTGRLAVTKNWNLNMVSGYDFKKQALSFTNFSISRDLRCWVANINWTPFGFNKQYSIQINLKSSAFQSLMINRQRGWYDNF